MKTTGSRMVAWLLLSGAVGLLMAGLGPPRPGHADAPSSPVSCVGKLPRDLQAFLRNNLPSWEIVDLPDLNQDDQLLWVSKSPTECPGVTVGRFFDLNEDAYAVLLVARDSREERLVVFQTHKGRITTRLVGEWNLLGGGAQAVIWTLEPGEYESRVDSTKIQTRLDSIVQEFMEKGANMYYWEGGQFRTLRISD